MSRETLVPQPEWQTLATLNIISPGVCVTFAPPRGEVQHLCSQVEALGPVAPAWFATLDAWLFGAGADDSRNPLKFWAGDVAEILLFSRALPEAERLAMEGYLRLKYGL